MCRVYNTIGCLNTLQIHLVRYNVDHFHTLNELISFRKNYRINEEQIISDHTLFIEKEKTELEEDISELNTANEQTKIDLRKQLKQKLDDLNQEIENLPETNSKIIPTIKDYWLNLILCIKFWFAQLKFQSDIALFSYQAKKLLSEKNKRLAYISLNFQDAVNESSFSSLQAFEKKKK